MSPARTTAMRALAIGALAALACWCAFRFAAQEAAVPAPLETLETLAAANSEAIELELPASDGSAPNFDATSLDEASSRSAAPLDSEDAALDAQADFLVLEIAAVDARGAPVAGAQAHLDLGRVRDLPSTALSPSSVRALRLAADSQEIPQSLHVPPGSLSLHVVRTDDAGLARFGIPRESASSGGLQLLLLGAESSARWSTRTLTSSTRVLMRLMPAAGAEVGVSDAAGRPKPGTYVDISDRLDADDGESATLRSSSARYQRTDELGRAHFDELAPGDYEFSCHDSSTNLTARERITLLEGQRHFIQLRLEPATALQPAVAGVVVDEHGQPLPRIQLRLRIDDGEWTSVVSNEQGEFGGIGAPGREVEIQAGGALWGDDFEPQPLRVAFGATQVRLQRARTLDWISVEIICRDESTQRPVSPARLTGTRYRAASPEDRAQFQLSSSGRTRLFFKDRDDWRVEIRAPGYLPQDAALSSAAVRGPDGLVLTLQLQRAQGFEQHER